jgi:hypothetical protein
MDRFLVINAVFASAAIVIGFYSHRLAAALVAWFWLAVIHSGLILLAMGQAGSMSVPELPLFADVLKMVAELLDSGIQMAGTYVAVDFANTALLAYFITTTGILLLLVLAAFVIRSLLTALVSLFAPQKASA